jgi:hypothetical protein
MLERRLQVLLDQEQYERVAAVARERRMSVGAVIREAIDRGLPSSGARRSAAARVLLEAPGMPVPSVEELRAELDNLHGRVQ